VVVVTRLPGVEGIRSGLRHAGDRVFDTLFGVDTARHVPLDELEFDDTAGLHYEPSNWINLILLRRALRSLGVGEQDVFIDLGCGKGQILLIAARFPFRRVIGLDLSERMLEVARRNVESHRLRARCGEVELVAADALRYDIPPDVTVCYYYNSFPRNVLEVVSERLVASADAHPRRVTMLSLRGTMDDVFLDRGFRLVDRHRRLLTYAYDPRPEGASRPPHRSAGVTA
jgi:SAM-dependent methyltransferase